MKRVNILSSHPVRYRMMDEIEQKYTSPFCLGRWNNRIPLASVIGNTLYAMIRHRLNENYDAGMNEA